MTTDKVGTVVIVNGEIVAWFADFTEEAREWCTENYFGQWLTWRAITPEIIPISKDELEKAERKASEFLEAIQGIKNDN